jgi:UPF0176 protein
MLPEFVNIAAYKFTSLDRLAERKQEFLPLCRRLNLRGTILLSPEGINIFLAGKRQEIDQFLAFLQAQPEFSDLEFKESFSDHQPFNRMLVRLKREIISMGVPEIRPGQRTSPKISAKELKSWLDEGKEVCLLDVRNDYEVEVGTFENAIPIGVDHFRKFPAATRALPAELREKPIVMFCTGGIRCEKAGPLMESQGFRNVYQLDGGILKYFEECGGAHYQGQCFVFDKRVALNPNLEETDLKVCYACQSVLQPEDQRSEWFEPGKYCPHCNPNAIPLEARLAQRKEKLVQATSPLPGCVPYVNYRPINISAKFDQRPLLEFLLSIHPELDADHWRQACQQGRVVYQDQPLAADQIVRAGWRIFHLVPDTVEPAVSNQVEFLFEDEGLIAIHKPAPLPMHPCGRFNKNTLQNFLRISYPHENLRILHRLDAETTGVLLLARNRATAVWFQQLFASGGIRKIYLARVQGKPLWQQTVCSARLSDKSSGPGGIRQVVVGDQEGMGAETHFRVLKSFADGTTLVECRPITGRTNQIRLHLAHLGYPVVGDTGYGGPADSHSVLHLHALQLDFEYPEGEPMSIRGAEPGWAKS